MKALNPFAPFWYTPIDEAGADNPTRFKVRGLDGAEIGYVSPEFILDDTARLVRGLTGKGIDLALKYGLVDWENFENDRGPLAFTAGNFGFIPHKIRAELAIQIVAPSYVKQEEKKTDHRPRGRA